jgi:hypothetical protein
MKKKAQGIIILAAGLIILFWGYNSSQSVSTKLGTALSSGTLDKATIIMIIGCLCVAFGFFKLFKIR